MPGDKKTKVALLTLFYEPYWSGAEKMVKKLAEGLDDKYDIFIITCRIDRTYLEQEKISGYNIIRVGNGIGMSSKLIFPLLALREVIRLKPDIIHAIMESYAGGALWLTKYFYPRAKRILTLQSGDLDEDIKQKKFLIRLFWRQIHKAPHQITAISKYLAQRVHKFGLNKPVLITPNGVDLASLPKLDIKNPGQVVMVGRLSWEKGHRYLLKAWAEVIREFPDTKLVLVGEGPERGNIESLIKELGLSNKVELRGSLPHNEALVEIAESDLFVCPSLAEGLGIVFIEAQAMGVPVIGTKVGGIPDVIENSRTGILVEPKSVEQLAQAIKKLLIDKELASTLSANALISVKKFEWGNIIEQFDDIYSSLIK